MQVQRPGLVQPRGAGLSWRSLLPRTVWGWSSVLLFVVFILGIVGFLGLRTAADRVAGVLGTVGAASLLGAFLSGAVGIAFRRERTPLPMLVVVFGAAAIVYVGAELITGLLGFGH